MAETKLHFIGEETIQIQHRFTPAELQGLAKTMAQGMLDVERLEDEKKDHAARLKTAIDSAYDDVSDAARKHRAGSEMRDAKAYQVADYDQGEIVWLDRGTGDVLKKRKMTGDENHIPLEFNPVPPFLPEPDSEPAVSGSEDAMPDDEGQDKAA